MAKIVSFVVFIAAFVSTWFLFNSSNKISLNTHAGIQSKFMLMVEQSIKKVRPETTDFEVLNIYTQALDDNQVSTHFSYRYSDVVEGEKVNQAMSGAAVLYRQPTENPEQELWVVKSVQTGNPQVEFQEGLVIDPTEPAPTTEPVAPATPEEKHH